MSAYLNIPEDRVPDEVHRIMSMPRLLDMIRQLRNALVYPPIWNDPYEAVELRTEMAYPLFRDSADGSIKMGLPFQGEPVRAGMIVHGSPADFSYYCQSWSAALESETMWRAYSANADSVTVAVSVKELLEQTRLALPSWSIYFGRVDYLPASEIEALTADGARNRQLQFSLVREGDPWGASWARSLLKKRDAFRHEEEYRLIAIRGRELMQTKCRLDILQYGVMPQNFVRRIQLDPRNARADEQLALLKGMGWIGEVTKSKLLDRPQLQVWNSPHPREWKP